jgi:hypothetical protein
LASKRHDLLHRRGQSLASARIVGNRRHEILEGEMDCLSVVLGRPNASVEERLAYPATGVPDHNLNSVAMVWRQPSMIRAIDLTHDQGVRSGVLKSVANHLPYSLRERLENLRIDVVTKLLPQEMGECLRPTGVPGAPEGYYDIQELGGSLSWKQPGTTGPGQKVA